MLASVNRTLAAIALSLVTHGSIGAQTGAPVGNTTATSPVDASRAEANAYASPEVELPERPYDEHGWPTWVSAQRLRGLPECPPDRPLSTQEPSRTNDVAFACHPPFPTPPGRNWTLQLGMPMGLAFAGDERASRAMGFDLGGDVFFSKRFGLGVGYRFVGVRPIGEDVDDDGIVDASPARIGLHMPHVGLRLRVLTDEPSRRGWLFGLDGTFAISAREDVSDVSSGPVLSLSIHRQVGMLTGPFFAGLWRFGLRYEQGFTGELAQYRTILASAQLGFEWNQDAPIGFDAPREQPKRAIAVHATVPLLSPRRRADVGVVSGIHLAFGMPFFGGTLEPRLRLGLERLGKRTGLNAPDGERVASRRRAMASGHLRVRPVRWLHADVGGGWRHVFGDGPLVESDGGFFEVGFGAGFVGCGLAFEPTLVYRRHFFDDDLEGHELGVMIQIGVASSQGAYPGSCGGALPGRNPAPPPPPEPPPPPPPPATQTQTQIEITPPSARIEVEVPRVEVEVEPVRVEVVIGAVVFGGAVQMRLDLSRLPLDTLRRAGFVELELVVPEASRARVEGELRATLDREGVRVNATSYVEATGVVQEVKAIFTIWPAGSGPR
jgi:hypothetical protein